MRHRLLRRVPLFDDRPDLRASTDGCLTVDLQPGDDVASDCFDLKSDSGLSAERSEFESGSRSEVPRQPGRVARFVVHDRLPQWQSNGDELRREPYCKQQQHSFQTRSDVLSLLGNAVASRRRRYSGSAINDLTRGVNCLNDERMLRSL